MTKDYLKFRNVIKKDSNLTLEEGYMLEVLFDYYNTSKKCAYPGYDVLMADLKTNRKAKISKILKSLVEKGYISIDKAGKKNTYKLLKYLFLSEKTGDNMPKDSDGNEPLSGQVHFTEVTEEVAAAEENKVIDITGFTKGQAIKVLKAAKDRSEDIQEAFNYAVSKGAKNLYSYTVWALNNMAAVKNTIEPVEENRSYKPKTKFDNFEPRQYNYDDLEKKLLGWS